MEQHGTTTGRKDRTELGQDAGRSSLAVSNSKLCGGEKPASTVVSHSLICCGVLSCYEHHLLSFAAMWVYFDPLLFVVL